MSQLGYSRPVDGVVRRRMEQVLPDVAPLVGVAQPGLALTPPVVQNSTLSQIGDVLNAGLAATARGIEFQAAMQDRAERQRREAEADRLRTEEGMAQVEQQFAKVREGEADFAAAQDIEVLVGQLERGEISPPQDFSPESQQEWARSIADARSGGQGQIYQDRYRQRVTPRLLSALQDARDRVIQRDRNDLVFALQNRAVSATPEDFTDIRAAASALGVQDNEFASRIIMPALEQAASTGNTQRLAELKPLVPASLQSQYESMSRTAQRLQSSQQDQAFASTLGVFNQRLNTLQTAALTGRASLSDMQALLQDSDALVQNVDPQYADSARVFSNSVRSLIASTQQEQLQAAVQQGENAVKAQYLQQAYAISQSGRLSSFVGDRGFEFQSQDGAVKVKLSRDEIISQVRDAQSEALRQQIEADPSIPDGQKPIAYGRGMAKWSAANNVPLTTVLRQTEESFGIVQNALQEGNEQNRDAMLADAARSMEQLKGVFQIRANTLGAENEKTLLFENAILLQENASQIMGKPLTNQEALAMVYNNTRNASVSRESVDRLAQKMADNDGTLFSSAKNGGDVREQIVKNLRVVSVMNPGLSDEKKLEQAKKMFERQGQYLNGYWTPLGYKLQDDYGTDPDTSVARIAEAVASRLKGNPEYVVNGEDITADDIALRRDDKTQQLFFVDMRIGPGRRIFSQDAKLPPSFSDNSLISLMNSDTVARTQAAIKASREVIDEGRPPVGFMGGQR